MARTPSGKRRANLRAMIEYADEVQWPQILQGYEEGLSKREVNPRTGVVIKNFCENLRSALDWLAEEIRDACGISSPRKIYFPICSTRADFDDKMKHWFPGLDTHSPDVWRYLLSMQSFSPHGESWLTEFNDVNNENKHFDLVVQTSTDAPVGSSAARKLGPIVLLEGSAEKGTWVEFRFGGTGTNAHMLLYSALVGVKYHTEEILGLLQ